MKYHCLHLPVWETLFLTRKIYRQQAFPDVPWAFIYRDPLHVMVSNLREKAKDNAPGPYCTGLKPQKLQSEYIQDLVLSVPGKTVENLTHEEYCAAYLVSFLSLVLG